MRERGKAHWGAAGMGTRRDMTAESRVPGRPEAAQAPVGQVSVVVLCGHTQTELHCAQTWAAGVGGCEL